MEHLFSVGYSESSIPLISGVPDKHNFQKWIPGNYYFPPFFGEGFRMVVKIFSTGFRVAQWSAYWFLTAASIIWIHLSEGGSFNPLGLPGFQAGEVKGGGGVVFVVLLYFNDVLLKQCNLNFTDPKYCQEVIFIYFNLLIRKKMVDYSHSYTKITSFLVILCSK